LTKIITNSIQLNLKDIETFEHILLIDNNIIKNNNDFKNLINVFYKNPIFEENTKIHLKLKLNNFKFIFSNFYTIRTGTIYKIKLSISSINSLLLELIKTIVYKLLFNSFISELLGIEFKFDFIASS
jgi:hypothetical protein